MTLQSPERPSLMTISDRAATQVRSVLNQRLQNALKKSEGIRLGVKTRGCSGLMYTLEYADEVNPQDEIIEDKGIKVFIDPKSVMFFIGCEMDYVQEKLSSGFTFRNPNEKGRCGCGESFHV